MVALGVYALGMKHSKLRVAIIIKPLGAIALGWGLWELFSTAAAGKRSARDLTAMTRVVG